MTLRLGRFAALGVGMAVLASATPAAADTVTQYYTSPGNYTAIVPPYAGSLNLVANGAAGADGATTGGNDAHGGTGGLGAEVNATLPIGAGTPFSPGDVLQVAVGSRGGGGRGGSGNEVGVAGGNGGGAASVTDLSAGNRIVAVAGGGGGGGGGGGLLAYNGGNGGQGTGTLGNGVGGSGVGAGGGGSLGDGGCNAVALGGDGGTAGGGTDAGGGGGGGDGLCGAPGGHAGGAGGGGGGGGGAGASFVSPFAVGTIGLTAFNGDANVVLRFTRGDTAPQITSADHASVPAGTGVTVAATGFPAPGFSLSGAPAWLSIDPTSGALGFPAGTVGHFTFTVIASNGVGAPATQAFTLDLTAPTLALPVPRAINAIVGSPVSFALSAAGGVGPYSWTGTPPAGLGLSSDGRLTGTPTAAGTSTFSVRATDSAVPNAASATENVTVAVAPRMLVVTTTALPDATVGKLYSRDLGADMGSAPYTWSLASGALPAGLVLQPSGVLVGGPTQAGTSAFTVKVADATGMSTSAKLSLTVQPAVQAAVFVTNGANSAVHSFALAATGNASPLTALAGPATGLNGTSGITIAQDGRTYVSSANGQSIAEYAYGATGNAPPAAVIAGAATRLASPQGLALDANGRLYAADAASSAITAYAPGATGNVAPAVALAGPHTGLSSPSAVTFDRAGHLWVANAGNSSLTEYAAGATGDAAPLAVISGFATRLAGPQGLALDVQGNLLVADTNDNSLDEFLTTMSGNVPPIRRIAGDATGLSFPTGVDVDATGNAYVSNQFGGVESFLFPANGNRTPLTDISGAATGLAAPGRLAVAPPLAVATGSLPVARVGRRYRAALRAELGTSPYRWSARRLPRGLRLRGGVLTGRPRHAGTVRFTVRVTDASHPTMQATRRLVLAVRR